MCVCVCVYVCGRECVPALACVYVSVSVVATYVESIALYRARNYYVTVHTEEMETTPSSPETTGDPTVQLEPTQNEMERERLQHQAESVSHCWSSW